MAKKLKLWFDRNLAKTLGNKVQNVLPEFDSSSYTQSVNQQIKSLELKDRIEVFADEFYKHLDSDYKKGIAVLLQILGPENEEETGMFKAFYWIMPVAKYIEKYGLSDFTLSMKAIEEVTKRNTSEYAIRPFIEQYPEKTLKRMLEWSKNKNRHIRRLSCEGARPRLPWAKKLEKLIENPDPLIPILSNLKADKSKYVQKSVANCLNDIYKDNLSIGKKIIKDWTAQEVAPETQWIIKHSLRNLLKAEDAWALKTMKTIKASKS